MSAGKKDVVELVAGRKTSGELVSERIPARWVEGKVYELLNTPILVLGVAAGDKVRVNGEQHEVIARGSNVAVQVFGPVGEDISIEADVCQLGGRLDSRNQRAIAFTIPITAGFPAIRELFDKLVQDDPALEWYYGNVYDPIDGVTPLGWWDSDGAI